MRPGGLINPRLARRVSTTRRYLAAAVAVGVASTVCLVVQAVLLGLIIQRAFLGHRPVSRLLTLFFALAGAFLARAVLSWLGELAAHRTSATVTSALRRQVLKTAVALGPSWLAGERKGELTSVTTQGVQALEVYFARYLPTAIVAAVAPPILLAWVLWADWRSFLILAVTVSVIPLFMVLLGLEAKRHAERQWDRLSGLAAAFYDLLEGLATLRAFGRVHAGRRTLDEAAEDFRLTTMSTLRVAFLSSLGPRGALRGGHGARGALLGAAPARRLAPPLGRPRGPGAGARGVPAAAARRHRVPREHGGPGGRRPHPRGPRRAWVRIRPRDGGRQPGANPAERQARVFAGRDAGGGDARPQHAAALGSHGLLPRPPSPGA